MTNDPYSVIILPVKVLVRSSDATKLSILEVINRAYDKPRLKYQIILSPRIKSIDVFFNDLGFDKDQDKCSLYLLFKDKNESIPHFDDLFETLNVRQANYIDNTSYYYPKVDRLFEPFNGNSLLATIGYKPIDKGIFEITGFTSFAKGCGVNLFNFSVAHIQDQFYVHKLLANVVLEHDLVDYYERKLGFEERDRVLFKKTDKSSAGFENNIEVSRDFHIAKLEKLLSSSE